MATRKITPQEQEIADSTGGRYRTDIPGGVVMNQRPPKGGSTYVPKEENLSGAGRGGQGGPTAKQASMSDAEKAAREEAAEMKLQERTDKAYENASKGMKNGGSASSRADGIATKGHTRGKMV